MFSRLAQPCDAMLALKVLMTEVYAFSSTSPESQLCHEGLAEPLLPP